MYHVIIILSFGLLVISCLFIDLVVINLFGLDWFVLCAGNKLLDALTMNEVLI